MKQILTFVFLLAAYSCNAQSNSTLILGSWHFTDSTKDKNTRLIFDKQKIIFKGYNFSDTARYQFTGNVNTIQTTDKSGRTDQVKILNLTKDKLVLFVTSQKDTFYLQRE